MLRSLSRAAAVASALVLSTTVMAQTEQSGRAFDHTFQALDGTELPLARFEGRVLLVVNTASLCGFTKQYKGLQALFERFEDAGLTVIGVPSNDFGRQEPGSAEEIAEFCEGAFGVRFPLTDKTTVKGDAAHPFYRWAATASDGRSVPRWNFHKYFVGRDGRLIAGFPSQVGPNAKALVSAIEAALAAPTGGS